MWDVCLFLSQIAICIFIIDCIFQMLKDFVPSNKTIFGIMAIVAGVIGLSRLKNYFNAKDAKKKAIKNLLLVILLKFRVNVNLLLKWID